MGEHNRVTEQKYKNIKNFIEKHKDEFVRLEDLDQYVASVKSISESTARNVRLTTDYTNYLERVYRFHRHPVTSKGKSVSSQGQGQSHKQVIYKRINGKTLDELKRDDCWRMRSSVMWLFFAVGFISFPMLVGGIWLATLFLTGGVPR